MESPIDKKVLTDFLNEANKQTYANISAPKTLPLRPKSQDYHFEKGNLIYHDTYFGARDFIGEEVVYQDGIPKWAMNYYGFILNPEASEKEVYKILRPALMQDSGDIIPVRGPREYSEGEHTYKNSADGDLSRFSGTEEIYLNRKLVYRCLYHGGFVE